MTLFILALVAFAVAGLVFGWLSWFRVQNLDRKVAQLQREVKLLKIRLTPDPQVMASDTARREPPADSAAPGSAPLPEASLSPAAPARPAGAFASTAAASPRRPAALPAVPDWSDRIREHWMVWLGGACVGLAGIFMVRYSIEQGLLGPAARVVLGVLTGLALHTGAEWLRRAHGSHAALAALAGGASLTLFAALLAALHLYQLLNPTLVFALLALVGLATMALALLHGPVLAGLGLLGAYLVPLLVGEGPGGAGIVLAYVLLISAAALLLMRYVFRPWLWLGMMAGALLWWVLTIADSGIDAWRGLYLAALAWLLLALPDGDWLLRRVSTGGFRESLQSGRSLDDMLPAGILLLSAVQAVSIALQGYDASAAANWLPLAALVLWSGGRRASVAVPAWIVLGLQLGAWLLWRLEAGENGFFLEALGQDQVAGFLRFCLLSVLLYSGIALWNFRRSPDSGLWLSMALLAPLLHLALAYLLCSPALPSPQWALLAFLAGACYLALSGWLLARRAAPPAPLWLMIAGHAGYSLAVAFHFREASMTLALALQVVSLAWVIRRFQQPALGWLLKGAVALVIVRLSLNPWLLAYPADLHWSLWTYGGATLCCVAAALLLKPHEELRMWAVGAALHLFTLTLWAEIRYQLYDGDIYSGRYRFLEAALNQSVFGALALVYHWRERFSSRLAPLYRLYSLALMGFALGNYALILLATFAGAPWAVEGVGERPLLNSMLLAFGTPAVLGWLTRRHYLPAFARRAGVFAALAGFVFISLEIRHLWQGAIDLDLPASNAELYTYSAVWLLLALAAILGGIWRFGEDLYRAGMALLVLVLAKLFLVDMAGLEGLLRVASFMGMGLGLLAIAYLHQRLRQARG